MAGRHKQLARTLVWGSGKMNDDASDGPDNNQEAKNQDQLHHMPSISLFPMNLFLFFLCDLPFGVATAELASDEDEESVCRKDRNKRNRRKLNEHMRAKNAMVRRKSIIQNKKPRRIENK